VAQCPHIEGMRVADLLEFLEGHELGAFLPGPTRGGKPPKYDRDWLLAVSIN
jgi:hypothetical protein